MPDTQSKQKFLQIVQNIMSTSEEDIGCDDCYEHVDRYVDMLESGEKPDEVMLQVQQHMNNCRCCQEELTALISVIEGHTDDPEQED